MPRANNSRSFLLTASLASLLSLAACSSGTGDSSYAKSAAPMPPITEMDAAMKSPAPQPLSESDTLTPVMPPVVPGTTTSITTTTTTAPLPGETVEARVARLEQTVGSLRSDYERIMPAFASLNTTNERISTLLDEIEKDTGKRPVAPAVPAPMAGLKTDAVTPMLSTKTPAVTTATAAKTTAPEPEIASPAAPAPAPASAKGNTVTSVRIGEHGTKTRLVMDLTAKTKPDFKYDLDNGEKLLLVDLPGSAWSGASGGKAPNSPLIESWSVQKGENGVSTVAIQLKKTARILSTEFLKAEGSDPARLVMDIAAGG